MLNTIFYYALLFGVVGAPFYFRYRTEELGVREETIEQIDMISSKLTYFIIAALFLMGFIGIQNRSSTLQEAAFFSCIFSFILLHSQHGKTVSQFRNHHQTPEERFRGSFRNFATFILLYACYFVTVELLIPHFGTIPSIVMAVMAITYAVPFLVRISLKTGKMYPSELKDLILGVFQKAGTPIAEIYLIENDQRRFFNAFVCGPRIDFGPFRRTLFMTRNLFELLEPEEIKAVVCHEAAHFKLNHIFKRATFSVGVLIFTIASITFPAVFVANLLKISKGPMMLTVLISTVITVYAQMYLLMKLIRKQEFEADQEAVSIGCHPGALIQALEKITKKNHSPRKSPEGWNRFFSLQTHPALEDRIEALVRGRIPADANLIPTWQTGLAYASFVVLAVSFAFIYRSEWMDQNNPQRSIASVKEAEKPQNTVTRQILPPPHIPIKWEEEEADE